MITLRKKKNILVIIMITVIGVVARIVITTNIHITVTMVYKQEKNNEVSNKITPELFHSDQCKQVC